jgi:hypothetical protein
VAEACIEAGRNVSNILSYEMPLTKSFDPHIYFDISDSIDAKLELLSLFESQSHKMFLESRAIKGLAQYRALQSRLGSNVSYAESFQIVKVSLDGNFAFMNSASSVDAKEPLTTHTPQEICECIYV